LSSASDGRFEPALNDDSGKESDRQKRLIESIKWIDEKLSSRALPVNYANPDGAKPRA